MDEDEDAPPLLVAVDGSDAQEAAISAEMEDVKVTKVPITIITGRLASVPCILLSFIARVLENSLSVCYDRPSIKLKSIGID